MSSLNIGGRYIQSPSQSICPQEMKVQVLDYESLLILWNDLD